MRRTRSLSVLASALFCTIIFTAQSSAQLSTNPDKFLGNITTYGSVNGGGIEYDSLWNQITCENETKWSSVEGNQGHYNWGGADNAYNYAKNHNFPFKFHTLVWGSQFPGWVKDLNVRRRKEAIVKWMDEVKKHYPDLEMIDVVNEAVEGHQADTRYIKEALGGAGKTGYDWIITAFEMAYERWPNAILIYNDFNTFQWNTQQFIDLVKTLRDAGAPIDAYGCQSHDLTDLDYSKFTQVEQDIQKALKMPLYITEYDIGTKDDNLQKQRYSEQIPYLWQKDYCAGITLWGYIYGATWIDEKDSQGNVITRGISGIIKNGVDRPAMEWLRKYMKSDAAKNAKSPFPGMKKEASVYIKPSTLTPTKDSPVTFTVRVGMRTETVESVRLKAKTGSLYKDVSDPLTEGPYVFTLTPTKTGDIPIQAIVITKEGNTYKRYGNIRVSNPRIPFKSMQLPGTIEAEDFDKSGEGVTFHDSDSNDEGKAGYRSDNEGVDIVKSDGRNVIGYTSAGEWLEYTVDVKTSGTFDYVATVSSGSDNSAFKISLVNDDSETVLSTVNVPNTESYDTYTTVSGRINKTIKAGKQIIRFTISGSNCNIDKVEFNIRSDVKYIQDNEELSNGTRYNLGGQRVDGYQRGINIINGRKVYIME